MANSADFYFSANAKEVVQAINGIQGRLRKLESEGKKADIGTPLADSMTAASGSAGMLKTALAGIGFAGFAAGAMKALGAVKSLTSAAVSAAAELQTYNTRFSTLLESEEKAAEHVAGLTRYAAETPFEMAGISKASASLLAFGVEAKDSMKVLSMLGDMASATGSDLAALARIYGKVTTGGRLYSDEVNQISERGLNLRAMLAEREGISVEQVRENFAAGKYDIKDLRWALEQATGEGGLFFEGAQKLSKTFEGQTSTLADNWKLYLAEIGERMLPMAEKMVKQGGQLLDTWGGPLLGAARDTAKALRTVWHWTSEAASEFNTWRKGLADMLSSARLMDGMAASAGLLGTWQTLMAAIQSSAELLVQPFRDLYETEKQINKLLKERAAMTAEPLFETRVAAQAAREKATQEAIAAVAAEKAAMAAERAAKAAEKEAETRKQMRAELANASEKRAREADRALFSSQNAAGMRAEIAARFLAATGQAWQGGFGADEAALSAAERNAANQGDRKAMAELTALREYAALYKKTAAEEVDAANKKAEALEKARVAEIDAAEVADATARGDHATAQRIQAEGTARSKFAELLRLGMSQQEAAQYAAAHAGRQHGSSTQAGGGEWLRDDLSGIGGGGAARRIPNAQLAIQRQQLTAAQLTNTLLEKLLTLPRSVSIPVTA
jgi:hypothetical protein